ncbi:MAG: ATP-binding cassette domain-containing protein [Pseudomonadota bacterium]
MPILTLDNISLAFGERQLLDKVSLSVQTGERVCLIGRNGEGKSTLLKVIANTVDVDEGTRWLRPGHRLAVLEQEAAESGNLTVFENVASGLPEHLAQLDQYTQALNAVNLDPTPDALSQLGQAEQALEAAGGWEQKRQIDALISKLELQPDTPLSQLSGGWRRRAMLARALARKPDLLLLDEPTNHLDIEAIAWLESFMLEFNGALVFVSHDRAFSRRLATRVIELDRGTLSSWQGGMEHYLERKEQVLAAQNKANALFDKRLSQEEAWVRQGIKARRTRNEGRVRALKAMREEHKRRREHLGAASMQLQSADLSGKIVVDASNASAGYGEDIVVRDVNLRILRGDRLGIIGPNGSGKSTLLKLLLGEIKPMAGQITLGTRLDPIYFDQQRDTLNPKNSVLDNVNDGSEYIQVQGQKRHVAGYLRDFLFPPERFHSPVSTLSGGERNRLLLAKLLAKPTNLMILDEPTNDLDVETLELLEELLLRFEGTLLVVSHDREFLDNVVSGIVLLDANGNCHEHVGNYSDFQRSLAARSKEKTRAPAKHTATPSAQPAGVQKSRSRSDKLSYKEQQELKALPAKIEELETRQAQLEQETSAADFYSQHHEKVSEQLGLLQATVDELTEAYEHWDALDARQ